MILTIVCDVLGRENNGTTVAAMNLIRYLKKQGHEVRVVCPDQEKEGLEGYYIMPKLNAGPLNSYVDKVGVTISLVDREKLADALRGADAVHIMTPFILSCAAVHMAKEMGLPVTAGFHCQAENITSHLFLMNSPTANHITYKELWKHFYQYVDAIHYPTQFIRDVFEREIGRTTNGYVISNGVGSRFAHQETEKPEAFRDRFVILFTGRYGKEKSHRRLIDGAALSRHASDIQLIFAGKGPLEKEIEAHAAEKLAHLPLMKFFSHEEMLQVINYADLYVHPAEVEIEAIACLEAISCGLVPVIADSPRCATRHFALDERNLFRYDDPADLAEKIDYWIEHPQEKELCSRRYMGYTRQFEQEHCMELMEQMMLETRARILSQKNH